MIRTRQGVSDLSTVTHCVRMLQPPLEYAYTFMVEPAAGSTALTITVDPAYAQDAMGKTYQHYKVTDAPADAVLGAKKFHVFTEQSHLMA